jgi:hypothetical protein
MNFKTLKLYYKLCCTHYMFRPIRPSSGVKSYISYVLTFVLLVPCTVVMSVSWGCFFLYIYLIGFVCCYLVFSSCNVSNIGLCVSMYSCIAFPYSICICVTFLVYLGVSLFCCSYDVHCVSYFPVRMSCVQYMIWVSWITVITSNCLYVLFVSGVKCSACLAYVFQWAILTFHCINTTFSLFVYFWLEL